MKKIAAVTKNVINQILHTQIYHLISISGEIDLQDLINYKYSDSSDSEDEEPPEKPAEDDLSTNSQYSDSEVDEVPEKPENKGKNSDSGEDEVLENPEIKGEAENSVELIIDYAEPLDD